MQIGISVQLEQKEWLTCYYKLYLGSFFLLCSFGIDSSLHCSWKQNNWFNSSKICTIKQCSKCVWRMDDLDGGAQCQLLPGAHGARFGPEAGKESHEFRQNTALLCDTFSWGQTNTSTYKSNYCSCSLVMYLVLERRKRPHRSPHRSLRNPPLQISTEISTLSLALIWAFLNEKREKI